MAKGKEWKRKVSTAAYTPSVCLTNTNEHKTEMENISLETYDGLQKATLFFKYLKRHATLFTEQYLYICLQ